MESFAVDFIVSPHKTMWHVVLEKTLEEIQPVHSEGDQPWDFFGRNDAKAETLATSWEELTHWKKLWCWEGLGAGGEGHGPGWDGWMASRTQWTWVWVNSGSWWWTGRPGVLWFMSRKESDTTERLNWTDDKYPLLSWFNFMITLAFQNYSQNHKWLLGPYRHYIWWYGFIWILQILEEQWASRRIEDLINTLSTFPPCHTIEVIWKIILIC